jgi:hypothetical protein
MLLISGLTIDVFDNERNITNCNNPTLDNIAESDYQILNDGSPATSNSRAKNEHIASTSLI